MSKYIELLKNRPGYRHLWMASVVSLFGDWFNSIASLIIVNRYTESGLAISWILLARTLPRFFVGPFAGVIADRFDRKKILVIVDVLRSVIVLSFLYVDRPERVWLIYALTIAQFIMASFFEPASSAMIPSLIKGNDELATANVLTSITWSTSLAVGAALGGGITAIFGAENALIIDGFTFLVSAALILMVKSDKDFVEVDNSKVKEGMLTGLKKGFQYIVKNPSSGLLTLIKGLNQFGTGDILTVVFAERYFHIGKEGAGAIGIIFSAAGLGAIMGPILFRKFSDKSYGSMVKAIKYGYMIAPFTWFLFAISQNVWIAAFAMMVRIMGASSNWTNSQIMMQTKVPNKFLGRVFSIDLAFFTLVSSLSIWLTGYLLDNLALDPRTLVKYISVATIFPILIWLSVEKYVKEPELITTE
jgi:MFS family permease